MRVFALVLTLGFVCAAGFASAQDAAYIHHIEGLSPANPNEIIAGSPVTIYYGIRVESACLQSGGMSLRFYSPDGAAWGDVSMSHNRDIPDNPLTLGGEPGIDDDTLGLWIADLGECRLPAGFDDWLVKLFLEFPESSIGKTFCIDSTCFSHAGAWLWNLGDGSTVEPQWDGPYCYKLVSCCYDYKGDTNLDGQMDISDLIAVVSYMFGGGDPLPCLAQVDFNNDLALDISDLTSFALSLFSSGSRVPCN